MFVVSVLIMTGKLTGFLFESIFMLFVGIESTFIFRCNYNEQFRS
nr:MAG TPA: hypothetical protein [Caudoviricetes sp.]